MERSAGDANLGDVWNSLKRRWRLFAMTAIGVVALVMAITLLIPPVYESEAVLRVKSESPASGMGGMIDDMLPGDIALPGLGLGGNADVATEMGVLRSRRLAEAVADSLGLHVELSRPFRTHRTKVLHVVHAGEDAVRGTYTLRRQGDGSYSVRASRTRGPVQVPERVMIGEPFEVGNMVLALQPDLADSPPNQIRFKVNRYRRMIRNLREDLQIARPESRAMLIELSYRHRDPRIAAGVINGIVERFLDYSLGEANRESRRKVTVLREQVDTYAAQLQEAERFLQTYQEQERLVAPEEQATLHVRRIAELQATNDAMTVEQAALGRVIDQIRTRAQGESATAAYRQLASFPSFISNRGVQDVLQALTELENERSTLLARRTTRDVDVQTIQGRIQELESQLFLLGNNYLEGLETQIGSTGAALDRFGQQLESIPAIELEYARRARERKLLSEVYLMLQARLKDAEVQLAIDDNDVRVIDGAIVADRPAFPRPSISLVLAVVLGVLAGIFAVVARETLNPSVQTRRDLERAMGASLLARIPLASRKRRGRTKRPGFLRTDPTVAAGASGLALLEDSWSAESESYRTLASNIGLAAPDARVLTVSSAGVGAGSTSVAANLAAAMAEQGRRVALVEADLRGGDLTRQLNVQAVAGWTDRDPSTASATPFVAIGQETLAGVLHLIPAGKQSVHPSQLLTGTRLDDLIAELNESYDYVIFDTPAIGEFNDAVLVAGKSDAAMLVARTGVTLREELEVAADALRRAGVALVGGALLVDGSSRRDRKQRNHRSASKTPA